MVIQFMMISHEMCVHMKKYRCFKKSFTTMKEYIRKFIQRIYTVFFKCHDIAKHTGFYLGWLWFDVISIGNAAEVPPVVSILPHAT
jgi:hypothetical protein